MKLQLTRNLGSVMCREIELIDLNGPWAKEDFAEGKVIEVKQKQFEYLVKHGLGVEPAAVKGVAK